MEIYPNFNIEKMNSEDKQLTLDKRYIRMALIWAENSYCKRRKVGALIFTCRSKRNHESRTIE